MPALNDLGEELITKVFWTEELTKPSSIDVGLFNDGTDALGDADDTGDITTEPTGASYSRQQVNFGNTDMSSSDNSNGNWQVDFVQQTFDTSDSSQDVDAWFAVASFQAEDTGDGSAQTHLIIFGGLDQTYNLDNIDSFNLDKAGASIT